MSEKLVEKAKEALLGAMFGKKNVDWNEVIAWARDICEDAMDDAEEHDEDPCEVDITLDGERFSAKAYDVIELLDCLEKEFLKEKKDG